MQPRDNDQYFIHADGGEPANPSLLTHLPLKLDAPSEGTSRRPSVPELGSPVHQSSTALVAPERILRPWSAGSFSRMAVGHHANDLAAAATRPRPSSSLHAWRGSASIAGDDTAVVATEREETASAARAGELISSFGVEMDDCDSPIEASMSAAAAVGGAGTMFDAQRDGRVPTQYSDSTIHGDPSPYYVNLLADDPEGLIPPGEHYFRGRLDTGSDYNLLATPVVERMQLIHIMKPVDESYRIRGLSTTSVPVRGRLTITVHVQFKGTGGIGGVEYRCRPQWDVVDDKYIGGSFDSLAGLPIINKSEELRAVLIADKAFPTTSSVASRVAKIDGHLEIGDDSVYVDTTTAVIDHSYGD